MNELYDNIKNTASSIDATLLMHIDALQKNTAKRISELEKKMLRAEKRKFGDEQHQIAAVKSILFPKGNLQERIDNFAPFYAIGGKEWIAFIYNHTFALEQLFRIVYY